MTVFLTILLLLSALGVLHTYVFYPWWLLRKAKGARTRAIPELAERVRREVVKRGESWPAVSVLMAAHNEEAVLAEKLASLAAQDYPGELRFFIGSDNSTDATNDLLRRAAAEDERFRPTLFTSRQGKPAIINQLAAQAGGDGVYLITDASVMLRPDVVTELVRPMLTDDRIGVVDATMVQTGARATGIGRAEETYINREVSLKRAEGLLWGVMIGPFGGCWAMRAAAFTPVPDNFLVDDFFLCMVAYEQGFRGVSSATAVVEEGVGQSIGDEFRRKVRISSGNWQNLVRFRRLWWPFWRSELAFAFFSHKVLRWWTPFLLLTGLAALAGLAATSRPPGNYLTGLLLEWAVYGTGVLVLLDLVLSSLGVHFRPARFVRYFLAMNAALLVGFYRYLTGINTNVWQPSQRH